MVATLPLLAAGLLLGQTADMPVPTNLPPSAKVYMYNNGVLVPVNNGQKSSVITQTSGEDSHPFLSKIQGWFTKRGSDPAPMTVTSPMMTPSPPVSMTTTTPTQAPMVTVPTAPAQAVMTPMTTGGEYARKMPTTTTTTTFQAPPPNTEVIVMTSNSPPPSAVAGKTMPAPAASPILQGNLHRIGRDDKFTWVTGQLEIEKGQYVLYYATPDTVDAHHGRILLNPQKVDMRNFHAGDLISVRGQLHAGHGVAIYQLTGADLIDRAKR
jgi:hypothetical protein